MDLTTYLKINGFEKVIWKDDGFDRGITYHSETTGKFFNVDDTTTIDDFKNFLDGNIKFKPITDLINPLELFIAQKGLNKSYYEIHEVKDLNESHVGYYLNWFDAINVCHGNIFKIYTHDITFDQTNIFDKIYKFFVIVKNKIQKYSALTYFYIRLLKTLF